MSLRPGETPEEAQERRLRESQRVEERVIPINGIRDWDRETQSVGTNLVVVEVRWLSVAAGTPSDICVLQLVMHLEGHHDRHATAIWFCRWSQRKSVRQA